MLRATAVDGTLWGGRKVDHFQVWKGAGHGIWYGHVEILRHYPQGPQGHESHEPEQDEGAC